MIAMADIKQFQFTGDIWKNCGASGGQEAALTNDLNFNKMMMGNYSTVFSQNQGFLKSLMANLQPIVNAGAGQQGFTPTELAAKNSQNINAAAASNQKVQQSIGESAAASNATPGVESGITQSERAAAATAIDQNMNNQAANITQQNYDVGRQNFWDATNLTATAPAALENPGTSAASQVNNSDANTSEQANANESANNSWQGLVTGLAGDAATAFACVSLLTSIMLSTGEYVYANELKIGNTLRGLGENVAIMDLIESIKDCVQLILENGLTIDVSTSHTFSMPAGGYTEAWEALGKSISTIHGESEVVSVQRSGSKPVIKICTDGSHSYVSNQIWSLQ